jgi:hypothetical protein
MRVSSTSFVFNAKTQRTLQMRILTNSPGGWGRS